VTLSHLISPPLQKSAKVGHPTDVTWTVNNPSLASIVTNGNGTGTLTGIAAGQVTITATAESTSGQAQVTILAGSSYPAGTAVWTAPAVTGFAPIQLVQAVPTASGPDLYSIQLSSDGTHSIVEALTADGEQLWQQTLPPLNKNAVPDAFGGLIVTEYDTCFTNQSAPLSVVDLEPVYGQPTWQIQAAALQGVGYCYGSLNDAPQIAVRGDGAVIVSEPTNNGFPQLTLVEANGTQISYSVPQTILINSQGQQVPVQCCMGAPIVNVDGTTYVENEARNINQSGIITSDTLNLIQINPDDTTSTIVLSSTTQDQALLPGNIIPDGNGGVLGTWTISPPAPPVPQFPYQAADVVSGVVGAPYNLPFSPTSVVVGQSPSLVLGENGVAFAAAPSTDTNNNPVNQISSFNIGNGAPNWNYQVAAQTTLIFAAATQGGGLDAKMTDSQNIDTIVSFDASGNLTTDFSGFSGVSYFANGLWFGFVGSTLNEVDANAMWASLVSNAFPLGNLYFERSALPVLDSKTNDSVKSMLGTVSQGLKTSNCAKVLSAGLSTQTQFANSPYSFDQAIMKGTKMTNYFDLTNASTANLTRRQITGGEDANDEPLSQYFPANGQALTTNNSGIQYKYTAIVFAAGVLAWQNQSNAKPKYTLTHEVFLHAYANQSDSAVFSNSVFQNNGLLNSNPSSSTNISNWISTDCKCTPGISTGTCNMNSASW